MNFTFIFLTALSILISSKNISALETSAIPLEKPNEAIFPSNILLLDQVFTHHVIVVEKSTQKIYLYQNDQGKPKFVKSYVSASGKSTGDKLIEGDLKTPEGVYLITEFKSKDNLTQMYGKEGEIYGIGAFVMNYPNIMDIREGKTGGGIWFHGTNDESRVFKGLDSRGCVVAVNADVKELSQYIELNKTNIVIVQDLHLLRENTWSFNKNKIETVVKNWLKAWKEEDLNNYISFYHVNEFKDNFKGNYQSFKNYKSSVFSAPGKPEINLSHISIFAFDKYAIVQFEQSYRSNTINDSGKKTLYLKKDQNYEWKIVAELFSRVPKNEQIVFTPSQRYFTN